MAAFAGDAGDFAAAILVELVRQCARMKRQMFADKRGDEVVAMVVAILHSQGGRDAVRGAGGLQVLRKKLPG